MNLPTGQKSEEEIQKMMKEQEKPAPKTMDNIVDESARFMATIMRGAADDKYNAQAVNAACNCSKQVYLLSRLRFDIDKWRGGDT